MKKTDYIIIWMVLLLVILSFLFIYFHNNGTPQWILIEVDGKLVEKFRLSEIEPGKIIAIKGPLGSSLIEFGQAKVRMKESPCPDGICESWGWISELGQIIVCMPNKVVIRIIEE